MGRAVENCARVVLCITGIALSIYAYFVETHAEGDIEYEALCDINDYVSCSAVFTSPYGKGFGIVRHIVGEDHFLNFPNSIFGMVFFTLQLSGIFARSKLALDILYWMTVSGILMCFYLAYILAFILHDFCVVCVSTYALSFGLHLLNHLARKAGGTSTEKKRQ